MKIGFFQFNPIFGQVERNLDLLEKTVTGQDADLIVLPELCTTGYQFISRDELGDLAEPVPDGYSCKRLAGLSKKTGIHFVAGIAEKENNDLYNTAVFVGPDGLLARYRKLHLFFEETLLFAPGSELPEVIEVNGCFIGILICFDWLFPEIFRILGLRGADLIVHPSNLVLPYCQAAMTTRSIENRIFTLTANRIGTESRGGKEPLCFTGESQITGVKGEVIHRAPADKEELRIVEIEPELARDKSITKYNSVFESRRTDIY